MSKGSPQQPQDLSQEQPEAKAIVMPITKPYDPDEFQDKVRQNIAIWLLILLTACAALVAYSVIWHPCDNAKDIALMLFTPLLTAVSTILGFYFGERRKR